MASVNTLYYSSYHLRTVYITIFSLGKFIKENSQYLNFIPFTFMFSTVFETLMQDGETSRDTRYSYSTAFSISVYCIAIP